MHVLFIPKWYPGRNDPQLGDFIRKQALAASAHARVSVLFLHPVADLPHLREQELTTSDGLWELRTYYRMSQGPGRRYLNFLRYRRAALHAVRRLERERGRPDLVHAHILIRAAWLARRLARRWKVPFLVSEQSSEFLDGSWERKPAWVRRFAARQVRGAAATVAVSPFLGEALVRHGLYSHAEVVPNVVPVEQVPLPAAGPADRFMMVADLVDRTKNVSGVVRALGLLRNRGVTLHLDLIGDGPDRGMLEGLVRDLRLHDSITFHGRLPNAEVLARMARTGAVVINSRVETFSVVTGEALALGKPVVASRCGGPAAFITPENGLLVPVGDDQALAEALLQVHERFAQYDHARIREGVGRAFSASAVGHALHSLYTRILSHG